MTDTHSDALVFFGATGDLAYKKIFPSLQAMVKRGHLNVPVVGVAKAGWNLDQLHARAKDSLEKHGGLDPAAFDKLSGLLRYVDGDYQDPATFAALRRELKDAKRPAHYLAIPPVLFEIAITSRASRSRWRRTSGFRAAGVFTIKLEPSATWCRTTSSRSCRTWRWSRPSAPIASPFATRRPKCCGRFHRSRRRTWCAASSTATAMKTGLRRTRRPRLSPS